MLTADFSTESLQARREWQDILKVMKEKNQLLALWGFLCMLFFALSLWLLIFFYLCLIFVTLINTCLGVFLLGLLFMGCLGFLDLVGYFLSHAREVFIYYLLKYFLMVFLLSSYSGTPMIQMLGHLTLSQRSLRLSSFLLIFFSFFLSAPFISTILCSTSLILSSASVILLLVPSRMFFISFIALFQRTQWHPTPVLLPGKSHGWRSLVGCSPCGR